MNWPRRIRLVAAIAATSTIAGALAGVVIAVLGFATLRAHRSPQLLSELLALGSQSGATLGLVLGPLVAFGPLRRVPLGRVFFRTLAGAAVGGLIGFVLGGLLAGHRLQLTMSLGLLGFSLSTAWTWWRASRGRRVSAVASAV